MTTAADILRENGLHPPSRGRYYTICPKCSASRSHAHQKCKVLGITIDDKGVQWGCNHCAWTGGAFYNGGRPNGRGGDAYVTIYDYMDVNGELLFQVCRKADKSGFPQRRPDGRGGWIWDTKSVRKVLYRLPELVEAIASQHAVLVVEGEKDADAAWKIGLPATCNPGGASEPGKRTKWRKEYSETLRNADIVIIPDHDEAGYAHAEAVARMSVEIAKRVRMLKLADHWPQCPEHGDLSNWLAAGHTREQLDELIEGAPDLATSEWQRLDDTTGAASFATKAGELFDPWAQFVVPPFPLDVLSPVVRDFVESQSVVIGCDPSAMAMAVLSTFSGALDHRFAVKMMRHGNWFERPRLWTLFVGPPSTKKTPIFNTATKPLEEHQQRLWRDFQAKLRAYEEAEERGDEDDVEKPEPPPRFVMWDTTTEKLGEILARSDKGLLVKRDEISGWIGALEKYANSSRGVPRIGGFICRRMMAGRMPWTASAAARTTLGTSQSASSVASSRRGFVSFAG